MEIKQIVKNTIKFVFVEVCYGLILSVVALGQKIINTIVTRGATTSEVQRLKGEIPLVVTEVLKNYNNSINLVTVGLCVVIVILMIYSAYKYVNKTYFNNTLEK